MSFAHIALALLIGIAWGGNFLACAISLQHFPPFLFTALRLVLVLILLLPWLLPIPKAQWPRLFAVCICNSVLHFGLSFWALHVASDISTVAIALQSYIPMTTLMAVFFLREKIGLTSSLAIAIAFLGVIILGFDPLVMKQPFALMVTLLSAVALAVGTVLTKGMRGMSAMSYQAWNAVIAIPFLLAISFAFESNQMSAVLNSDWVDWTGVVYAAIIASIVGHGCLYYLIQRNPVSSITPYLLIAPVFAVFLGVMFWGDHPGPKLWIGGAMVLGGVLMVTLRAAHRARLVRIQQL